MVLIKSKRATVHVTGTGVGLYPRSSHSSDANVRDDR